MITIKIIIATIAGIHIGANTHTHDHVITPISFNTMKAIARSPQNVIPPAVELLLFELLNLPSPPIQIHNH